MFKSKESQNLIPGGQTIVGQSVKLEGDFESQDDIVIYGEVTGKVKTNKNLRVEQEAKIKGDLEGENIFIAGKAEGNVRCQGKLEITSSGKVSGDIQTKIILVAEGAVFCGQCQMETEKLNKLPSSK